MAAYKPSTRNPNYYSKTVQIYENNTFQSN